MIRYLAIVFVIAFVLIAVPALAVEAQHGRYQAFPILIGNNTSGYLILDTQNGELWSWTFLVQGKLIYEGICRPQAFKGTFFVDGMLVHPELKQK